MPDPMLLKIQALLAKAGATEFDAEADAFYAKAQALMLQHAVTDQMLREATPADQRDKPVIVRWRFTTSTANLKGRCTLMQTVGNNNRVRLVFDGEDKHNVHMVGFQADIEFCQTLYAALWVQAWRVGSRCKSTSELTAFLIGFARECGDRMKQVNNTVAEVNTAPGNALALRDVKEQVDEAYDDEFAGKTHIAKTQRSVDYAGYHNGRRAGQSADISGGRRNLGNTKALSQ